MTYNQQDTTTDIQNLIDPLLEDFGKVLDNIVEEKPDQEYFCTHDINIKNVFDCQEEMETFINAGGCLFDIFIKAFDKSDSEFEQYSSLYHVITDKLNYCNEKLKTFLDGLKIALNDVYNNIGLKDVFDCSCELKKLINCFSAIDNISWIAFGGNSASLSSLIMEITKKLGRWVEMLDYVLDDIKLEIPDGKGLNYSSVPWGWSQAIKDVANLSVTDDQIILNDLRNIIKECKVRQEILTR